MKLIKMLFIVISFLLCLSVNRVLLYSQEVGNSIFSSAFPIVYLKDGEGIFVYDFLKGETKCIYKCNSANQHFFQERLLFYKDYIIFGVYDIKDGYRPYDEWKEEFYIVNKDGGEVKPYSTLMFKEKGKFGFTVSLTGDFHRKEMPSVFSNFPHDIKLIISETGGSPQIKSLYKKFDNKCVFVAGDTEDGTPDKTIRLWDLEANKIETILEFYDRHISIVHGGGGYDYPYLLNEHEVIFFEYPRERGLHTWLGMGFCRWAYLKKFNIQTAETINVDKLDGSAEYPKISPCGKFVVYGIENTKMSKKTEIPIYDIFVKDIQSGNKRKIGIGHSYFWMK